MGLAKRIIPCLDVTAGRVVKGVQFVNLRDAGDPVEVARRYDEQGADELTFLDITASSDDRDIILHIIEDVAAQVFIPLTVGGGVRSVDDVRRLLAAGADKVSINTAAVTNPQLIEEASSRFGSQCIVVAIDAKQVHPAQVGTSRLTLPPSPSGGGAGGEGIHPPSPSGGGAGGEGIHPPSPLGGGAGGEGGEHPRWEVYTHGGRRPTGLDAVEWAQRMETLGAGEILLTSMDRDGAKTGFDLRLTRAIVDAVTIPVIASGGVGNLQHLVDGVKQGGADAVLAASIFHYGEYTIGEAKRYMAAQGVEVRL